MPGCCTRTSSCASSSRSAWSRPASAGSSSSGRQEGRASPFHTARPGVVIGKKGADIEKLRGDLAKMTGSEVSLNIVEIRKPEIDAKLVAENIAQQLERRVAFRRAMKRAVQSAMRLGAQGIRINCRRPAGRRRDRAHGVVSRGPGAAAHAARRCRFRLGDRQDHLWHLRRQGLGVQGRDPGPRPDGAGQALAEDSRPAR